MFATGLGKDNQVGTTRNGLPNHKRAKPPNSKQPPKQQDCGQGGCSLIKLQNNKRVVCGSRSNVKDVKILIDHDQIQRSPNSNISNQKPRARAPHCTRSSPEHPIYSIILTEFPAGPRVRFLPEPSPRPTLTPLDYSPEVDHLPTIDHPPENSTTPHLDWRFKIDL
ncbi:hypothetical protein KEM48_002976 [Puccinia striiformis f. sp. tritici PST-130]|nr:hypothetical protein KEM48_002976 [Puccinia striiformis f. sp. tritici PST-130]